MLIIEAIIIILLSQGILLALLLIYFNVPHIPSPTWEELVTGIMTDLKRFIKALSK